MDANRWSKAERAVAEARPVAANGSGATCHAQHSDSRGFQGYQQVAAAQDDGQRQMRLTQRVGNLARCTLMAHEVVVLLLPFRNQPTEMSDNNNNK